MERTAVFIDARLIDKLAIKHQLRFDMSRVASFAADEGKLVRVYYYYCMPYRGPNASEEDERRYGNHQRFIDYLARLERFELRQGRLAFRGHDSGTGKPIYEQRGVEVMMTADLARVAHSRLFHRVVLFTNDSDFVPAIELVKDAGVEVVLYYDPETGHRDLLAAADAVRPIDEMFIEATQRQSRPELV